MTERSWVNCPICGESDMRSEDGLTTCTNLECLSNGGDSGTAIDWKQRFKDQVADNIETKAKHRTKLAEVLLELDQARHRITELERQVKRMTPAAEQLAKAEQALQDAATKHMITVRDLKAEIRDKQTIIARSQRAAIEGVIDWLQHVADKLPEPTPEEFAAS